MDSCEDGNESPCSVKAIFFFWLYKRPSAFQFVDCNLKLTAILINRFDTLRKAIKMRRQAFPSLLDDHAVGQD